MTDELQELLQRFTLAARAHGAASEQGDHRRANPIALDLMAMREMLKLHGSRGEDSVLALTDDSDPWVRTWAASVVLTFAPEKGEAILRQVADQRGASGLAAYTVLLDWMQQRRAGTSSTRQVGG